MSVSRIVLLSSLVLTLAFSAAVAQEGSRGPAGPPDRDHWDPAAMRQHREARQMERDKALHDVLGIQPAQESAFAAFATAMRPPEWRHDGGGGPGRP